MGFKAISKKYDKELDANCNEQYDKDQ